MDLAGAFLGLESLAKLTIAQHLGNFRKDVEVALRCSFRYQQKDQQSHRFVIRRVKWNWLLNPQYGSQRILQTLDPTMRNGNAMSQAS